VDREGKRRTYGNEDLIEERLQLRRELRSRPPAAEVSEPGPQRLL